MTPHQLIDILKKERERRGLSQREMGLLLGMTQGALSLVESGQRVNPDTLTKYAEALGMRVAYKSEWHIEQKE